MGQCSSLPAEFVCARGGDSPLELVPTVLLLVIMQFCPARSIAQLGCSSKRLHAVALSKQAWKCAVVPLRIRTSHTLQPVSFPAHVSSAVDMDCSDGITDQRMESMMRSSFDRLAEGSIRSLNALCYPELSPVQWVRILSAPSMQSVRCVRFVRGPGESQLTDETLRALSKLTQLDTLSMYADLWESCDWTLLGLFPALTDLSMIAASQRRLLGVSLCPRLERLSLEHPQLPGELFDDFFAQPNLASLRELCLENYNAFDGTIGRGLSRRGFAALGNLTRLDLTRITEIDRLLLHASAAPSLRHVQVEFTDDAWQYRKSFVPGTDAVSALLHARPLLHMWLRFTSSRDPCDSALGTFFAELQAHFRCRITHASRPQKQHGLELTVHCSHGQH